MSRNYEPSLTREALAGTSSRRVKARPLSPRVRILPLTMIMVFLLLGVKVSDLYQSGRAIQLQLQQANAGTAIAADNKDSSKSPPQQSMDEAKAEEEKKIASLKDESDKITGKDKDRQFSQIEVDLLQSLRERRKEIEGRSRELDLKENLLDATELRINDKISEIKALEQKVSSLLKKYSDQEESHVRSLVKIYESMKPKSAAAIFNELEMPILLEVVDQMSERKVAPVLAAMDPMKAKEVTSDLAKMRKLNSLKMKN